MSRFPYPSVANEAEIEYEVGEDFDELLDIGEYEDERCEDSLAALGRQSVRAESD